MPPPKSKARAHRNVALYPSSPDITSLNREALALKVARHSHCSECEDCRGLTPNPLFNVVLDSEWNPVSSGHVGYIKACRCGHDVGDHASFEDVSAEEVNRRGRVAIRLDELLEVSIDIIVTFSSIIFIYGTRTKANYLILTTKTRISFRCASKCEYQKRC